MINRYCLILSLILTSLLSYGQKNEFRPEWSVGVGFGPTFSSVDFQPQVSTSSKMQYQGGIAVRYISEKHLGLIAELNYSQQGWDEHWRENPNGYEYSRQLNYLEMPIMTHIYFGNKVRFIFNIGPKIGYLVSENEKINQSLADYLSSGEVSQYTLTYQYYRKADKKIDYGLIAGMGLEFRTGLGNFTLEGRYSFGLGDIYNSNRSDVFARSANRVISAKLTYFFKSF